MEAINKEDKRKGELLVFDIEKSFNIYNPTAPFQIQGKKLILARVENIQAHTSYMVPFFFEDNK